MSPAVNLTLEEVPFAILDVVKARILANRRKRDDLRKPRPSLRPRPQFRQFGASSKSWRKPQHGAAVLGDEHRYAVTYVAWGSENRYRLYSCDGSNHIDFTALDTNRGSSEFFMLPAGGNNAIFVSPKNAAGTISPRAFLIGKATVREVGVSTNLRAIINIPDFYVGPGNWLAQCRFGDVQAFTTYSSRAFFFGNGPGIYSYLRNPVAADDAVYSQPSYEGTPETFWKREAAAEQFIGANLLPPDGSLAISELSPKRALRYTGQYPPSSYSFAPVNGTENPIWNVEDEVVDTLMTTGPFTDGQGQPLPVWAFPFWDWGNPDYCQQQLRILGFSDADMTP